MFEIILLPNPLCPQNKYNSITTDDDVKINTNNNNKKLNLKINTNNNKTSQ